MKNILIDTDVILDFFFDRKPFSENASQILSLCESKEVMGFVTPVICNNIYYILRKTARHSKVIEKMSQLMTFLDVLMMDKDIVIQALSSCFKDFENALQNYSSIKSGYIDVIITRNAKVYVKSEIGVLTPENYIKSITASRLQNI
jgi:predicted nucleic-acid-binding protein